MVPPTQPSSAVAVLVVCVSHFPAVRVCPSAGIRTCAKQTAFLNASNGRALALRAARAMQVQTHTLGAYVRLLAQLVSMIFACARA